jgi:hypothetical protein
MEQKNYGDVTIGMWGIIYLLYHIDYLSTGVI